MKASAMSVMADRGILDITTGKPGEDGKKSTSSGSSNKRDARQKAWLSWGCDKQPSRGATARPPGTGPRASCSGGNVGQDSSFNTHLFLHGELGVKWLSQKAQGTICRGGVQGEGGAR